MTAITRIRGRVLDMRYRGNTLWLSVDRYLLAISPDGAQRAIDVRHGLPSGGPLLVDREGSLWVGSFVGLQQYPEPDTQRWTELDGLPWQHAYNVAYTDGALWVNTWGGSVRFDLRDGNPRIYRGMQHVSGVLCSDRESRVWQIVDGKLQYWRDGRLFLARDFGKSRIGLGGCSPARDGGVWLATNRGVWHAQPRTGQVERVLGLPAFGANYFAIHSWQTDDGALAIADGNTICRYQLDGLQARLHACQQHLDGELARIQPIAPGRYWLGSDTGLFEFDGQGSRRVPGDRALPGRRIFTIEAAGSGGYWAVGPGAFNRISPCDDCAAGFHILENVGPWQGVPADSALNVVELPSGDLWIAGNCGVFRVPAEARTSPLSVPEVVLVRKALDGRAVAAGQLLRMGPQHGELTLAFAALSYRDHSLVRYRFRTAVDEDWSPPTDNPELVFVRPKHGEYHVAAQASLDGRHWSVPVVFDFSVAPPWYAMWWAQVAFLAMILLACGGGVRLWLEHRLRLERQRLRIAMDLHDELGSGLGAISMLAGAAGRGGLEGRESQRLLHDITDTAARLENGLRTVVWSMRQPYADMHQLLIEIGDQARHLFPGPVPVLSVQKPSAIPPTAVNPVVRRHVQMILLEALHNIARHAHAREITLWARAESAGRWEVVLQDDGAGFDQRIETCGSGLESMGRRARLIGAELTLHSVPGVGTTVKLIFHPRGCRHD